MDPYPLLFRTNYNFQFPIKITVFIQINIVKFIDPLSLSLPSPSTLQSMIICFISVITFNFREKQRISSIFLYNQSWTSPTFQGRSLCFIKVICLKKLYFPKGVHEFITHGPLLLFITNYKFQKNHSFHSNKYCKIRKKFNKEIFEMIRLLKTA